MPKKISEETPEQQSERFKKAVQGMVDAGELNPTEADANFDRVIGRIAEQREKWFSGEGDQANPPSEPD